MRGARYCKRRNESFVPGAVPGLLRREMPPSRRHGPDACRPACAAPIPDRYFASAVRPCRPRDTLFTLYAFNHELARAREVTRQPGLALIRLQWWREVVEGAARAHEVATPLQAALAGRAAAARRPAGDDRGAGAGRRRQEFADAGRLARLAGSSAPARWRWPPAGRWGRPHRCTWDRLRSAGGRATPCRGAAAQHGGLYAASRAAACCRPDVLARARAGCRVRRPPILPAPAHGRRCGPSLPPRGSAGASWHAAEPCVARAWISAAALPAVLGRRDLVRPRPRAAARRPAGGGTGPLGDRTLRHCGTAPEAPRLGSGRGRSGVRPAAAATLSAQGCASMDYPWSVVGTHPRSSFGVAGPARAVALHQDRAGMAARGDPAAGAVPRGARDRGCICSGRSIPSRPSSICASRRPTSPPSRR